MLLLHHLCLFALLGDSAYLARPASRRQRSFSNYCAGISALLLLHLLPLTMTGCGGGQSTTTPTQPAAPVTPTGLVATAGNSQIALSWSASSGAATYTVYRAAQSGGEGTTAYKSGLTSTSFTDTGLTNGATYFYTVAAVNSGGVSGQSAEASATPTMGTGLLTSVTTDASRYTPGATATITVTLSNTSINSVSGTLAVNIVHLGELTESLTPQSFVLSADQSSSLTFSWSTPSTDFTGYLVEATATASDNSALGAMNSAIDVSSTWTKFPRYGYLTSNSFGTTSPNITAIINQLTRFHIDGLQYYDWEWKHHVPLSGTVSAPSTSWTDDGSSQTVYAAAVRSFISAGHANNIVAMPYNSIYSALNGTDDFKAYWQDGSGVSQNWGLYASSAGSSGSMISFDQWQYMDPSNPQWQQYLLNQQMQVIQAFGFDGFHADTFGDLDEMGYTSTGTVAGVTNDSCTTDASTWGDSTTVNNNAGSRNFINGTFPSFLQYAKGVLGNYYLIFNPVSYDHAHCETNASPVDILYTELWPNGDGFTTYETLKQAIDTAQTESQTATGTAKSLVVAAYVDYNPNSGAGSGFNLPDVLLVDATLFASGGSHIELGDGANMLNQANFTTNSIPMNSTLTTQVGAYYDFLTAYENLLRDGQTNTTQSVAISGQTVTSTATANSIWAITKSDSSHEILHLINFSGESSTEWQTGACGGCTYTSPHPAPTTLTNLSVKYYNINPIHGVYLASPDINRGTPANLAFTAGSDSGGSYITFTLPSLQYWDMVYMTN
jgi:dextranase